MTTDRPWADLPNAKHIDAVLADGKSKPAHVWGAAWRSVWTIEMDEWDDVRTIAVRAAPNALWVAVWNAVFDLPAGRYNSVRDAIRALIAWDDSADLLDLPADTLRTMIDLAPPPVCYQAALLLPWVIVREAI